MNKNVKMLPTGTGPVTLVAYVETPGLISRERRLLSREFPGVDVERLLPFERSFDNAAPALDLAERLSDELPGEQNLYTVQPVAPCNLSWMDVLPFVRDCVHERRGSFDEEYVARRLEEPRCWAFLIHTLAGGIPPGFGLLVDKCTKATLLRRYVDLGRLWDDVFDE